MTAAAEREARANWIQTTLALARALARDSWRISFVVRRGLLTFIGRVHPRDAFATDNDNARGAA